MEKLIISSCLKLEIESPLKISWLNIGFCLLLFIVFVSNTIAQTSGTIWLTPTDTYILGQGFNSSTKVGMGNAISQSDFVVKNVYQSSSTTDVTYSYDYTSSSNFQKFGASVNFNADLVSVYANYNQDSYQNSSYQSDQFTLLVTNIDTVKTILNINNAQSYNNNISSQLNFTRSYGDNLVSTIGYGRKLIATLELSRSSSSDFQSMQAGFGGSYNGFFLSGSASAYFNSGLSNVKSSADFKLHLQTIGPQNNINLSTLTSSLVNSIVSICTDNSITDKMASITNLFSSVDLNSTQGRSALYIQTAPYTNYGINISDNPFTSISSSNIQEMIECYRNLELCKSQLNQLNNYLNITEDTISKYYEIVVDLENSLVQKYEDYKSNPNSPAFNSSDFFPSSQLTWFLNTNIKTYLESKSFTINGQVVGNSVYQDISTDFGVLGGLKNVVVNVSSSIGESRYWQAFVCFLLDYQLSSQIQYCFDRTNPGGSFPWYSGSNGLYYSFNNYTIPNDGISTYATSISNENSYFNGDVLKLGNTTVNYTLPLDSSIKPSPLKVPSLSFTGSLIIGRNNLNVIDQINTDSQGGISLKSFNSSIISVSGLYLIPIGNGIVDLELSLGSTSAYTSTTVSATFTVTGIVQQIPNIVSTGGNINNNNPIDLTNYISTNSDGNLTFKIFGSSLASISGNNLYPLANGVVTVLGILSSTQNYSSVTTDLVFNIAFGATNPVSSFLGTTINSKTPLNLSSYFQTNSNGITVFSTQSSCAGIIGTMLTPICNGDIIVTAFTGATSTFNSSSINAKFTVIGLAAIDNNEIASSETIYPNPTTGLLKLTNNQFESQNFKLIDPKGNITKQGVFSSGLNEINISELDNGIYYLQYIDKVQKIVLIK